jgi:D-beta-D-heptose 7-phosphate kinase/D-beta-D-heptose 1-phosphate adenosyltransferase
MLERAAAGRAGSAERKVVSLEEAVRESRDVAAGGGRAVFTNGCFDLVHRGHVALLEEARRRGELLIVGLNSDESARRLKGPSRPVLGEAERAYVLASLAPVDLVVIFDEDTPERLIREIDPRVLVKGADYAESEIVGADIVKSRGGEVVRVPLVEGASTSSIVERVRNGSSGDSGSPSP